MDAHINAFGGTNSTPKKRVLFVITQSELGGAQRFILQFIEQAKKDSFDFTVAVGTDGDATFTSLLAESGIRILTIPDLKRNISPISDLIAIRQIKNLIKKTKPETLFLISSKAGFIGSLAAQFCHPRPKVVYRIGGWTFNDPWPAWIKSLWRFLEKISAPWKDVIIVNNTHDLNQAQEIGIKPRQNVVLVHNGLDPYKIKFLSRDESRAKILSKLQKNISDWQDKKIIGTITNLYPAKGLEYLIETAEKITDASVVFCVFGEGSQRPMLEKLIAHKKLGDRFFLLGHTFHEQDAAYLPAFDIFVLSSVKEGSPWVVFEAMAAKLPIIATRVGAVPEIIENGVSGYIVEPRNPDQIAQHITTLLGSESKAKEMGIQAHQRLLFAFNVETTVHQIEKLL